MKGIVFKTLAATALAAAAFVGSAMAADDPMEAYYGNTLIVSAPGKMEAHIWYNKDGTMESFSYNMKPDGSFTVAGHDGKYHVAGGKLCSTLQGQKEECATFTAHKVGDKWDETPTAGMYKGVAQSVSLEQGLK